MHAFHASTRRPGRIRALSALPAAIVLLCGAPARAAPLPAAIDACALLTVEEVSAAVGQKVEAGRPFDNGLGEDGAYSTTCIWAAPLAAGAEPNPTLRLGGRGFVIVSAMNWAGGAAQAQRFLESFEEAFRTHGIESKPVAVDVGADRSLWWGDGVAARKNSVSFGVSVAQFEDRAERQPRAERLARLVVPRLP